MTGWGIRAAAGDRSAVPVEMRFIDMFMAALGALIFMAMLLAYLIPNIPPVKIEAGPKPANAVESQPFKIITRSIPQGRSGNRYDVAFAYRGGNDPVSWEISAGATEKPTELTFDRAAGTLSGIPKTARAWSFVVRAIDARNHVADQAYNLIVEEVKTKSRKFELIVTSIMLAVLLLCWLFFRAGVSSSKQVLKGCRDAYAHGRSTYTIQTAVGVTEQIDLPQGIATYEGHVKTFAGMSSGALCMSLLAAAWLVWRIWRG